MKLSVLLKIGFLKCQKMLKTHVGGTKIAGRLQCTKYLLFAKIFPKPGSANYPKHFTVRFLVKMSEYECFEQNLIFEVSKNVESPRGGRQNCRVASMH